jgi:hypothetical protein
MDTPCKTYGQALQEIASKGAQDKPHAMSTRQLGNNLLHESPRNGQIAKYPVVAYGASGYTGMLIMDWLIDRQIPFTAVAQTRRTREMMARCVGKVLKKNLRAQYWHNAESKN